MRLAIVSYAEYHTMANLIVHYLRRKEAEAEESGQQGDAMPGNKTHTHHAVWLIRYSVDMLVSFPLWGEQTYIQTKGHTTGILLQRLSCVIWQQFP